MFIATKQLPEKLQNAIKSIGYSKADISVNREEKVSPVVISGQGSKGVFGIVNLNTGESQLTYGSWGGANMFNPDNIVDNMTESVTLVDGLVAIKGSVGNTVSLSLVCNGNTLVSALPSGESTELTSDEKKVLRVFIQYKAFARKENFVADESRKQGIDNWQLAEKEASERYDACLTSLESKGFLKANKAGAVSITTEGKNQAFAK